MLFDRLKTPAYKVYTNKRNVKRSAIIRLGSNGKAGAEFKINWLCQPRNGLIHLLHCSAEKREARKPVLFVFLPYVLPSAILNFPILSSKSSSTSTSSMETSWITPAPISKLPGTHWNSTKEKRLKSQTMMSDLQPSILLDHPSASCVTWGSFACFLLWKMGPRGWLWKWNEMLHAMR